MAEINSVVIVGRLTRDAEFKYTQTGTAVVRFSLAVNRQKKVGDEWQKEANFFEFTMMGKSAEGVHKYLQKGGLVGVQGELKQNRWTTDDGQARSKIEVFVHSLQLLGGKSQGDQSTNAETPSGASSEQLEDDVPF